jgi:hypothetical protein
LEAKGRGILLLHDIHPATVVSVVNSIQLAKDAESDDPLRDVGSLQNNF